MGQGAGIFLNGVEIAALGGYSTGYRFYPMDREVVGLLREGLVGPPPTLRQHRTGKRTRIQCYDFHHLSGPDWVP